MQLTDVNVIVGGLQVPAEDVTVLILPRVTDDASITLGAALGPRLLTVTVNVTVPPGETGFGMAVGGVFHSEMSVPAVLQMTWSMMRFPFWIGPRKYSSTALTIIDRPDLMRSLNTYMNRSVTDGWTTTVPLTV